LTQRGKSYHIVVKAKLYKNLTISAACEAIITKTKKLTEEYNKRINKNRKTNPTLIDKNVTGTCCSHVLAVLAVPAIYSRIAN
jgi:hypothetical protein